MNLVNKTQAIQAELTKIVTHCNETGNFNTAQAAQNALQQVATLVIRCEADAEQEAVRAADGG